MRKQSIGSKSIIYRDEGDKWEVRNLGQTPKADGWGIESIVLPKYL
jgi:hypothetical protein